MVEEVMEGKKGEGLIYEAFMNLKLKCWGNRLR